MDHYEKKWNNKPDDKWDISLKNMQIEGFFMLFLSGVFAAATMHYLIAKIAGPLIFGRAWCSYTCWTANTRIIIKESYPRNASGAAPVPMNVRKPLFQ